jgi:hypothetical protein
MPAWLVFVSHRVAHPEMGKFVEVVEVVEVVERRGLTSSYLLVGCSWGKLSDFAVF